MSLLGLFRRRKRSSLRRPTVFKSRLDAFTEQWLRRLAAYLERKTAYWDRKSKLIALVVFCGLFGGLSLWLLFRALGKL